MNTVSKPTVTAKGFSDPAIRKFEDRAARRRREKEARKGSRRRSQAEQEVTFDHDCAAEAFPIVASAAWAKDMGWSHSNGVVCPKCGDVGMNDM